MLWPSFAKPRRRPPPRGARDLRPGALLIGLVGPAVIIAWVLLVAGWIR